MYPSSAGGAGTAGFGAMLGGAVSDASAGEDTSAALAGSLTSSGGGASAIGAGGASAIGDGGVASLVRAETSGSAGSSATLAI
jgi:hypothetical protein